MLHARFHAVGRGQARVGGAAALLLGGALAAGLAGCGGSEPNPNDPAKFIGTWVTNMGTADISCPPIALPTQQVMGQQLVFTKGTDAPLEVTLLNCKIKYDIAGDVATAKMGQMCDLTIPAGGQMLGVTFTVQKAVFTLKDGGKVGEIDQRGQIKLRGMIPNLPPGMMIPENCTLIVNGTATKMP